MSLKSSYKQGSPVRLGGLGCGQASCAALSMFAQIMKLWHHSLYAGAAFGPRDSGQHS